MLINNLCLVGGSMFFNYNPKTFYSQYRNYFGNIKHQRTVDNLNQLLEGIQKHQKELNQDCLLEQIAYILATIHHESYDWRHNVYYALLKEYRASNRNPRIKRLQDRYWGSGYYGRGLIQITWKTNYQKAQKLTGQPLVDNPDILLEDYDINVLLAIKGMVNGMYTGKKLNDYINSARTDFYHARRIINGLDKAGQIEKYAKNFLKILQKSQDM